MQVTTEQIDPCKVALTITVEPAILKSARQKAFQQASQRLALPGFRKGKVPPHLAKQYLDPAQLTQRAVESVVPDAYAEAVKETAVEPFADPDFEVVELKDDETAPLVFKALVPLKPQITLGPYKGLALEKRLLTVRDSDVDEQIGQVRERFAEFPEIDERGSETGDLLLVELSATVEGRDLPDLAEPKATVIEIGKNFPAFDDALVGLNKGDDKTIETTYPDDFADESLRGKKATFSVKVNELRSRVLPELNDEFVGKAHNTAKTIDEFRAAIHDGLLKAAVEMSDNELEFNLINEIVKNSTIHFPEVLLRAELQEEARQLDEQLKERKSNFGEYLQQQGMSAAQFQQQMVMGAAQRIRNSLVLSEVARTEELTVTDEDLDTRLDEIASNAGVSSIALRAFYEQEEGVRLNRLRDQVLTEKIITFLKDASTITERSLTSDELKAEQEIADAAARAAAAASAPAEIGETEIAEVVDADASVADAPLAESPAVAKRKPRAKKADEKSEETPAE